MARIQSRSGEPCIATFLCAPHRCPNARLGAAQAPAWGWLCLGRTKVPQRTPAEDESHWACCPLVVHGSQATPLSRSPSPAKPAAGGFFSLPLPLLPGLFILAATRHCSWPGPSAGKRSCGLGPVASFPLLPEDGRDILGECDNAMLLCFHPLPTCPLRECSSVGSHGTCPDGCNGDDTRCLCVEELSSPVHQNRTPAMPGWVLRLVPHQCAAPR